MNGAADVLIVGAGPTGLMLANQLARRSVRARIIDRHTGPSLQTRALGVQARTLEIYSHLCIVERALELGKRATGANIWVQGRRAARLPLGDIGRDLSPYPFLLILGQDDNERLLGDALCKQGMAVEWSTELVGLAQDASHVKATLKQPDGTIEEVTVGWVAGCDGARSAVRELNGIAFEGAPYEHVFFVADTRVTGPMVPDELNVYLWREGFHLFFPMRGTDHWRLVGILPPHVRGRDDLTFEKVIPSVRRQAGTELSPPPLLPARRRRPHPQSGGRARHEHGPAGCLQPGLEARARRVGTSGCGAARLLRGRARAGSQAAAQHDRPGLFAGGSRQLAGGAVPHSGCSEDHGVPDGPQLGSEARISHHLSDWYSLPQQLTVGDPGGPA